MRHFMGQKGTEISPLYRHLNRGKRVLQLDLKSSKGKAVFTTLAKNADVLLESFRPGVMDRLGFSRQVLNNINPSLIHCALSGFGQNGPYRERAGHDLTYCAVSGALSSTGTRDQPVITFPPIADHAGAMQATNSILAALLQRTRSGKGAFIDVSLCESTLAWQYLTLFEAKRGGENQREELLINGGAACYNIYKTADGRFVALAALEEKFWHAFCEAIGRMEWLSRQHEALPQRELIHELRELFATGSLNHWQTLLGSVDCCFETIPLACEVATHPQHQARRLLNDFAPTYPAWINDKPVSVKEEINQLEPDQLPDWIQR